MCSAGSLKPLRSYFVVMPVVLRLRKQTSIFPSKSSLWSCCHGRNLLILFLSCTSVLPAGQCLCRGAQGLLLQLRAHQCVCAGPGAAPEQFPDGSCAHPSFPTTCDRHCPGPGHSLCPVQPTEQPEAQLLIYSGGGCSRK